MAEVTAFICIFSRFNQVLDRMLWGISRPLTKLDRLFWVCTRVGYSQILGFIIELIITFPLKMRIHWFLGYVSGQTQIIYCWWYLHDIPWYILMIFSILDLYPLHLYNDIAHDIPTIISNYSIISYLFISTFIVGQNHTGIMLLQGDTFNISHHILILFRKVS